MTPARNLRTSVRRWVGCGLFVLFAAGSAMAQQLPPNPYTEQVAKPRLLVLTTGRVVDGRIEPNPGGYLVYLNTGEMFIPFTQVKLTAGTMSEAYRKLRLTMPEQTATQHVELARWCLTNRLYGFAKGEVQEALVLEPTRRDARALLRRLEELTNPDRPLHHKPIPTAPRTFDGFLNERPQALAGLSSEAASVFITKVQPLLKNKCGNASCHGPKSQTGFQLTPVVNFRGNRAISEKNLQAVLKQLDLQKPAMSPLLTVPLRQHGLRGQEVYRGRVGDQQKQLLYNWVTLLARENPQLATNTPAQPQSHIQQVSGTQPYSPAKQQTPLTAPGWPPRKSGTPQYFPPSGNPISAPPQTAPPSESPFLNQVLQKERPDAFDPHEFNSQTPRGTP